MSGLRSESSRRTLSLKSWRLLNLPSASAAGLTISRRFGTVVHSLQNGPLCQPSKSCHRRDPDERRLRPRYCWVCCTSTNGGYCASATLSGLKSRRSSFGYYWLKAEPRLEVGYCGMRTEFSGVGIFCLLRYLRQKS